LGNVGWWREKEKKGFSLERDIRGRKCGNHAVGRKTGVDGDEGEGVADLRKWGGICLRGKIGRRGERVGMVRVGGGVVGQRGHGMKVIRKIQGTQKATS